MNYINHFKLGSWSTSLCWFFDETKRLECWWRCCDLLNMTVDHECFGVMYPYTAPTWRNAKIRMFRNTSFILYSGPGSSPGSSRSLVSAIASCWFSAFFVVLCESCKTRNNLAKRLLAHPNATPTLTEFILLASSEVALLSLLACGSTKMRGLFNIDGASWRSR